MTTRLQDSHPPQNSCLRLSSFPTQIREIAAKLNRLSPNWQDMRPFYANRDDLVDTLRRVAREAEGAR